MVSSYIAAHHVPCAHLWLHLHFSLSIPRAFSPGFLKVIRGVEALLS